MRSLFLKIFLSYWLAQALFIVLAILVTLALRPQREFSIFEEQQSSILDGAMTAYRSGGASELRSYLRSVRDSQHVRVYLFDAQGQELAGRHVPDWVQQVEQGKRRTADSIWGRLRPLQFLRQSGTASDGQRYTLVTELPPGQPALFGPHGVPGLAITIAIISSGLVCYFLARYLTSPVVRLRAATLKLAAGDLTARAGVPGFRRRDEMAGLVRDFDGMAERLEKLVKAQARLLNDISHELRSPLARLNVALALARQRTGPEAQNSLDRAEREAERLNELIGHLLTVARLESGEDAMQRLPVDLRELVLEVAKDADFEAQSRRCHVEAEVGAGECLVTGDPGLLHSAIENVVRNATRYTQEGTTVQVRLEKQEGPRGWEAVLQVLDSGPGVPEDALDKMFRPFYRIDDARGRRTGGVGLGLAITQRSVRLHEGSVRACNRPQGGLMVEIRLPLTGAGTEEMPAEEVAPAFEDRS
jgi:two-component system, OmpR family, sensor histidine kinase CpxA